MSKKHGFATFVYEQTNRNLVEEFQPAPETKYLCIGHWWIEKCQRLQTRAHTLDQGWKPGYLALGYQFQFRCVETYMSGFDFGLVSRLLKNRFQFRFQFCLRVASVSGFQFLLSFIQESYFTVNTNNLNPLLLGLFALLR